MQHQEPASTGRGFSRRVVMAGMAGTAGALLLPAPAWASLDGFLRWLGYNPLKVHENPMPDLPELAALPGDPVIGNPDGDLTVIYLTDVNCPTCKIQSPMLMGAVKSDGKIKLVVKEAAILGAKSREAAAILVAAARIGRDEYTALHEALMALKGPVNGERALAAAADLNLDREKLARDAADPTAIAVVDRSIALYKQIKVPGVPSYGVKGVFYNPDDGLEFDPGELLRRARL